MNYTNPNNLDHNDTPEDWLNSSLIFARSLSLIFKENEGVVVDLMGDMRFGDEGNIKKVIVFFSFKDFFLPSFTIVSLGCSVA